ncbi:vacuolar protein-sorting-associated protein 25 isoform X2 [Grus americana]|uniref:vacuolar protein-sorting-associated protein 25 isoform X2 n=1 Tax=Grus americana TaxID=9117 RepID=UPI0024079F86|nr:vacuolar protein-sorting-associated protein 25 isoform X2 [Grus americana]
MNAAACWGEGGPAEPPHPTRAGSRQHECFFPCARPTGRVGPRCLSSGQPLLSFSTCNPLKANGFIAEVTRRSWGAALERPLIRPSVVVLGIRWSRRRQLPGTLIAVCPQPVLSSLSCLPCPALRGRLGIASAAVLLTALVDGASPGPGHSSAPLGSSEASRFTMKILDKGTRAYQRPSRDPCPTLCLTEELGRSASLRRVPVPGQRGAPGRDPRVEAATEPARRSLGSVSAGPTLPVGLPAQLGAGRPQDPVADVLGLSCGHPAPCCAEGESINVCWPVLGLILQLAPPLPELPDLPPLQQLQNETRRCLSCGSG